MCECVSVCERGREKSECVCEREREKSECVSVSVREREGEE